MHLPCEARAGALPGLWHPHATLPCPPGSHCNGAARRRLGPGLYPQVSQGQLHPTYLPKDPEVLDAGSIPKVILPLVGMPYNLFLPLKLVLPSLQVIPFSCLRRRASSFPPGNPPASSVHKPLRCPAILLGLPRRVPQVPTCSATMSVAPKAFSHPKSSPGCLPHGHGWENCPSSSPSHVPVWHQCLQFSLLLTTQMFLHCITGSRATSGGGGERNRHCRA